MTRRWQAHEVIDMVADGDSFDPWDEDLVSTDPLAFVDTKPYTQRLRDAATDSGTSEAVVTGAARIGGREVALVVGAFEFLAGTQGVVVGERVTRAFDRAAVRGLPVIGLPTSGGTRMQEGALAFVQMLKIAASVAAHRRHGGRYVAWLRHPTTGGVLASWGSLAQVTWAQPGALIGLTGPRVIAQLEGTRLPDHVQRADHLATHGVVDDVVAASQLVTRLPVALTVLGAAPRRGGDDLHRAPADTALPARPLSASLDAWDAVTRSRDPDRPGLPALLNVATEDVVALRGDGAGGRDDACTTVMCTWQGRRVVVVGHDRPPGARGARLGAVGYRAARRAMRFADALGLPIVAVIDTQGAAATGAAESGGVAREIARCMATMSQLTVPTVAVLLAEGSGGGAIAWLAADRVVAAEHAWLGPISPEGASSILFRTTDRAPEIARAQAIDTSSLQAIGLVDRVVDEDGDWVTAVCDAVVEQMTFLLAQPTNERLAARAARLRSIGTAAPWADRPR